MSEIVPKTLTAFVLPPFYSSRALCNRIATGWQRVVFWAEAGDIDRALATFFNLAELQNFARSNFTDEAILRGPAPR